MSRYSVVLFAISILTMVCACAAELSPAAQIQLAHQHTLGMRDIGEIEADLQLAQQNYSREKQLFDEGIAPRKDLEAAEAAWKKKQIDLAARRATLQEDEQAIRNKFRLPTAPPQRLDESDLDGILQDGSQKHHTYARVQQ